MCASLIQPYFLEHTLPVEEEKMNEVNESRRKFLRTAGLGAAGAATAVVLAPVVSQVEPIEKTETPQGKGYHLTDHIRKYYQTARL